MSESEALALHRSVGAHGLGEKNKLELSRVLMMLERLLHRILEYRGCLRYVTSSPSTE